MRNVMKTLPAVSELERVRVQTLVLLLNRYGSHLLVFIIKQTILILTRHWFI